MLAASPVADGDGEVRADLHADRAGQGLAGGIEYSRDLFDGATIERLAGHLVRLLAAVVADPLRSLPEIPLLSAAESQQALVEWNDTAAAYPREACLPELFAAVARALPDAPAIVAPEDIWTYGRLDAASNRLARRLQSLGVGLATPVCVSMDRSPELIVGILAILKAGGLYVPLDAGYPDERLAFMLADAGAGIVLVHAATRERLAGLVHPMKAVEVVEIGEGDPESLDGGPLDVRVPAESLAYVTYTSGSTGRPKGIAVPHRAVVRLVRESNFARLGPGDRMGQVANISFDAATWEIWGALLNGAALVVIPRDVRACPRRSRRGVAGGRGHRAVPDHGAVHPDGPRGAGCLRGSARSAVRGRGGRSGRGAVGAGGRAAAASPPCVRADREHDLCVVAPPP